MTWPELFSNTYQRYLLKTFRDHLPFNDIPIKLYLRAKHREDTTDIVLEAAFFQPTRIRRTRRALGLSSESSYRFERGIDMLAMPDALARAVALIRAVAGGDMREPPIDLWPEPQQPRSVFLREARVSHLLGVPIPRKENTQEIPTTDRCLLNVHPHQRIRFPCPPIWQSLEPNTNCKT